MSFHYCHRKAHGPYIKCICNHLLGLYEKNWSFFKWLLQNLQLFHSLPTKVTSSIQSIFLIFIFSIAFDFLHFNISSKLTYHHQTTANFVYFKLKPKNVSKFRRGVFWMNSSFACLCFSSYLRTVRWTFKKKFQLFPKKKLIKFYDWEQNTTMTFLFGLRHSISNLLDGYFRQAIKRITHNSISNWIKSTLDSKIVCTAFDWWNVIIFASNSKISRKRKKKLKIRQKFIFSFSLELVHFASKIE